MTTQRRRTPRRVRDLLARLQQMLIQAGGRSPGQRPNPPEPEPAAPARDTRRARRHVYPRAGDDATTQFLDAASAAGFAVLLDLPLTQPNAGTPERYVVLYSEARAAFITFETTYSGASVSHGFLFANWKSRNTHDFVIPAFCQFRGHTALSMIRDKIAHLDCDGDFVSPWQAPTNMLLLHSGDFDRPARRPLRKPAPAAPPRRTPSPGSRFDALEIAPPQSTTTRKRPTPTAEPHRPTPEQADAARKLSLPEHVRRATFEPRATAQAEPT